MSGTVALQVEKEEPTPNTNGRPSTDWNAALARKDTTKACQESGKRIPATLSWKNLVVTAKDVKGHEKQILQGVDGYVEPSTMLAIMGPSGTFLNIFNCRSVVLRTTLCLRALPPSLCLRALSLSLRHVSSLHCKAISFPSPLLVYFCRLWQEYSSGYSR